jgi:hypothetical protein
MDAKKKTFLALILGVFWIGLAIWQWGTMKEPVRVPLTNVTGPPTSGQTAKAKSGGLRVNLELLASARTQREETFSAPRNIFAVPSPDGTLSVGRDTPQVSEQSPAPEQALLEQVAMVEMAQYRYLGFLRLGEGRTNKDMAVLSKNEEVVVAKVGDHVEKHLVLKAITPESVTIRDTGTRIDQTVPLSEEPPVQQ